MKKTLLLTLFVSLIIAENKNINFRHITVDKDGLSESSVYDIFQDSNGFIWMPFGGTWDSIIHPFRMSHNLMFFTIFFVVINSLFSIII